MFLDFANAEKSYRMLLCVVNELFADFFILFVIIINVFVSAKHRFSGDENKPLALLKIGIQQVFFSHSVISFKFRLP
jgi:hypothetical protein